jgi:hypothetical protein
MLQTLKLNNEKWKKKYLFYDEKSLVGLTPVFVFSFLLFLRSLEMAETSTSTEIYLRLNGRIQEEMNRKTRPNKFIKGIQKTLIHNVLLRFGNL